MTFAPRITFGSLDFTDAPFLLLPDRDMGSPETLAEVVDSLLADGDVVVFNRSGNRTISLTVYIEDADSAALAEAERSLALEVGKNNELTVYPGDGFGEASVYDTFVGSMQHVVDDDAERAGLRRYDLSFPALPFAHPVDPTTVALTYGTATSGTTLDDGSSTTGWSALEPSGAGVSTTTYLGEAAIQVGPYSRGPGNLTWRAQRASLALTAGRPFLAVDVAEDASRSYLQSVQLRFNGGSLVDPLATEPQSNGYVRYFFQHALAGTTADIELRVIMTSWVGGSAESLYVGGLHSYASAPSAGLMIVLVEGSQRAPFSLRVSRASGTLGEVFVFADPAMLEFGYNPGVSSTWEFAPAGTYTAAIPNTATINKTYVLTINGQSSTTRALGTGETLWFEFHLGATRTGRLGPLTITLTEDGSPITVPTSTRLFRNADETSLVATRSVASANLFIDSPTVESPAVGLWAGSSSDGSGATSVTSLAICADPLTLVPPVTALYVSKSGTATNIEAEVTYFSRHHTFVSQGS